MVSAVDVLNYFYLHQAFFIQNLQNVIPSSEGFFMSVTKIADPAYAIAIVFPVTASVNTALAADILVAAVVSEWSNTLLKWLLMEHRPYWWVKEYGGDGRAVPELVQTSLTCETGPGSPSGHIMGSAAVLIVFLRFFQNYCITSITDLSPKQVKVRKTLLWIILVILLILVSISRVIISAHFPHQCLLGAVIGISLGYVLTESKGRFCIGDRWKTASRCKMFAVAVIMSLISAFGFLVHFLLGADPQWSVRLAFKWCRNPEYVHVSTTPLFSLVRDSGAMFGLALSSPVSTRSQMKFYPVVGVVLVILLVVSMQMLTDLIPTHNAVSFYAGQLSAFSALSFLLISVVPYIANLIYLAINSTFNYVPLDVV